MAHISKNIRILGALAFLAIGLIGCGDSNLIGPENSLEVNNATDTFQWQASALDKVSQTLTYTWKTTGTLGNVNQSTSTLTSGTATLRISDADGAEVYSKSLGENGTFKTSTGTTGDWTIVVVLKDITGTLNFRVETP